MSEPVLQCPDCDTRATGEHRLRRHGMAPTKSGGHSWTPAEEGAKVSAAARYGSTATHRPKMRAVQPLIRPLLFPI